MLKELVKDEETIKLIEEGYEEFQELGDELADAKRERVKVQYYTGSKFFKDKYRKKSKYFFNYTVKKFIEKIDVLLEKNDN